MLRYCVFFFLISGLSIGLMSATAYVGMIAGYLSPLEMAALRARLEAIDDARPPDVLLVGDSSLSHGISSDTFHELTGQRALNLGLPGVFGYAGSLNLIRRAREQFDVRTVVIMHSIELASREPSELGAALTEPTPTFVGTLSIIRHALGVGHLTKIIDGIVFGVEIDRRFVDGFPAQNRTTFDDPVFAVPASAIRSDKIAELFRLGAYCRSEKLHCLWAHGVYWKESCRASRDYIAALGQAIAAAGLHSVTPEPLCFAKNKLGNAPDHIRPDLKDLTTGLFVDRLRRALQPT